jgi:high-affinity Fe2+/Pb2+ permease
METDRWDASTMPRPFVAWAAMAVSLAISVVVFAIGSLNGFASLPFREAQVLGRLPTIAIAGLIIYVSVKSDRAAFKRQKRFRYFGVLTIVACLIYAI